MVNTLVPPLYEPVTPDGKPVTFAPVPLPPTRYVILVIAEFTQRDCALVPTAEVKLIVALLVTVMVPVKETGQLPVAVTVKLYVPAEVAVPLMVKVPIPSYVPVTPVGKPPDVMDAPVAVPPIA